MFINDQIAVGEDTLAGAAVRFEKPETRNQLIDSQMRPIGDKARIAAKAPQKCGRERNDAGDAGEILRSSSEFDPSAMLVLGSMAGTISRSPSVPTVLGDSPLSLRPPCQLSWSSPTLLLIPNPLLSPFAIPDSHRPSASVSRHLSYPLVLSYFSSPDLSQRRPSHSLPVTRYAPFFSCVYFPHVPPPHHPSSPPHLSVKDPKRQRRTIQKQQATPTLDSLSAPTSSVTAAHQSLRLRENPPKPYAPYPADLRVPTFTLSYLPYPFSALTSPPPHHEGMNLRPHLHLNVRPTTCLTPK